MNSYELRTLIFNAEMALCDLRGFASSPDCVSRQKATERAADLREVAAKINELVDGKNQKPLLG